METDHRKITMKAYGRHRQHPGNHRNFPLQKGHVMWWEVENDKVKSKKSARQDNDKVINDELSEQGPEKNGRHVYRR